MKKNSQSTNLGHKIKIGAEFPTVEATKREERVGGGRGTKAAAKGYISKG